MHNGSGGIMMFLLCYVLYVCMAQVGLSNESSACSSILGHHRITSTPVPFIVVDIFICIYINNIYNNSFRNKCL